MSPFVQLHLLVALVATTAIFGRLASVSAPVLVCWRTFLAALGAFAWVSLVHRRPIWLGWRQTRSMLGIGSIIGLHWLAFFGAIKIANISICLAGLATLSLFTAFTEPLLLRRRVRPFEVLLGLIVVAGIGIIASGLVKSGSEQYLLGLGVAMIAALLAAVFPVLNRKLVTRGGDPMLMVGWEMVGACLACLVALPVFDPDGYPALLSPQGLDWLWIFCLAWICTVFGHAYHIKLLRSITAYAGNLAMNFEPVYGILAAALLFGEYHQLQPAFYIGTLAILVANLLHPVLERRARLPET